MMDITIAIDKLDKIGIEKVKDELTAKGLTMEQIAAVESYISIAGTNEEKINQLETLFNTIAVGMEGIAELKTLLDNCSKSKQNPNLVIDPSLARGLNYYTGTIFEVKANGVQMGSIGGGGRYDDLTGIFGLKDMSGVGISFGLDRIYLVIEELNLFPETVTSTSKALFINYGKKEAFYSMKAITKLRNFGIKVELYPDAVKVGKQFMHADKRAIKYAVIVGETEMNEGKFALKNLVSGEQMLLNFEELKNALINN
jgi:histidyl-tRNA synthetase